MSRSDRLADFAFEVASAAQQTLSLDELQAVLRHGFDELGAPVFVGVEATLTKEGPEIDIRFGATSPEWEARYQTAGHAKSDPIVQHMLASADVLYWSELPAHRLMDKAAQKVMSEARAFGLAEGLVAPMHRPGGGVGAILLMGEGLDAADPRQRHAAGLLCSVFDATARRLRREAAADVAPRLLSPRETQAVSLLRHGSNKVIGKSLGLSENRIAELLASARRKLKASTRADLLLKAQELGLLITDGGLVTSHPGRGASFA